MGLIKYIIGLLEHFIGLIDDIASFPTRRLERRRMSCVWYRKILVGMHRRMTV
jgi:hypothetical protein